MNIAFRVDASTQIGSGHFVRCLTLADRLRQQGDDTTFVCRWIPDHFKQMLAVRGHAFVELPLPTSDFVADTNDDSQYSKWLGVTQDQDAEETVAALAGKEWDWLVVDHYALDRRWETRLRACAADILVIDDLANRDHDCDLLLDQNRLQEDIQAYRNRVPDGCRLLLGPRYAMLAAAYRQHHAQAMPRQANVQRVFVFFGGVDVHGYTVHAIHALAHLGHANLAVDVVAGAQNPHLDEIMQLCLRHAYACHIQTERMAELMSTADVAIGAGGGNLWERCAVGLPALVLCTAENQRDQVEAAARARLIYLPDAAEDVVGQIEDHLKALIRNRSLRQSISARSLEFVDGRGADRVVSAMSYRRVQIRRATPEDCEKIFEWRNHPEVRKYARNASSISQQEHRKWYAAVLSDCNRILLVATCDGDDLGVVRFDLNAAQEAEVSIYLSPARLKSQMGEPLLVGAEHWLLQNRPGVARIRAVVQAGNASSRGLFLKAGYLMESTTFFKDLGTARMHP